MRTTSSSPRPLGVARGSAVMAGALTFVVVVLALGAYGWVTNGACLEDARQPIDTARWSGSQRLAAWPPAAMRCTWTAPSGSHVSWTITAWPLWIVYGAIALAGLLAAWEWFAAARSRRS